MVIVMEKEIIEAMSRIVSDSENNRVNQDDLIFLRNNLKNIYNIDVEVLRKFVCAMLTKDDIDMGIKILEKSNVLMVAFPELEKTKGVEQPSKYHNHDVYNHIIEAVKYSENDLVLRLTMLLHDIAKPLTQNIDENGKITFYGHGIRGANLAYKVLHRLGFSRDVCNEVSLYVMHHMDYAPTEKSFNKMLKELGNDLGKVDKFLKVKTYDKYACKGKDDEIARKAEEEIGEYRKFLDKYIR